MRREGDRFATEMLDFEIIDLDGETVDKVLITPLAKSAAKPHSHRVLNSP